MDFSHALNKPSPSSWALKTHGAGAGTATIMELEKLERTGNATGRGAQAV
jgi:hypothetical protein